jgi:hypothetical protein
MGLTSHHPEEGGGSVLDETAQKNSSRKSTTAEQVGAPVPYPIASRQDSGLP